MRPLRFSINITLDGCSDHRAGIPDEDLHRHHTDNLANAGAIIFGRVTYEMMEEAWRPQVERPAWMQPFARVMDAAKKYVVSSKLKQVDWNAELVRGDLATAITDLKQQPGQPLYVAGIKLAQGLTELGLIDEYEFVIHPRLAGHGPSLFAGLSKYVDLKLVSHKALGSGAVVLQYRRQA